jgi:hypothetical protein
MPAAGLKTPMIRACPVPEFRKMLKEQMSLLKMDHNLPAAI